MFINAAVIIFSFLFILLLKVKKPLYQKDSIEIFSIQAPRQFSVEVPKSNDTVRIRIVLEPSYLAQKYGP